MYWLGPCLGGSLAALVYHYGFDYASTDVNDNDGNGNDEEESPMNEKLQTGTPLHERFS